MKFKNHLKMDCRASAGCWARAGMFELLGDNACCMATANKEDNWFTWCWGAGCICCWMLTAKDGAIICRRVCWTELFGWVWGRFGGGTGAVDWLSAPTIKGKLGFLAMLSASWGLPAKLPRSVTAASVEIDAICGCWHDVDVTFIKEGLAFQEFKLGCVALKLLPPNGFWWLTPLLLVGTWFFNRSIAAPILVVLPWMIGAGCNGGKVASSPSANLIRNRSSSLSISIFAILISWGENCGLSNKRWIRLPRQAAPAYFLVIRIGSQCSLPARNERRVSPLGKVMSPDEK